MPRDTSHRRHVDPVAYAIPDAAIAMGISVRTVNELVATGALRSAKIGRRRVITRRAIDDFLQAREAEASGE